MEDEEKEKLNEEAERYLLRKRMKDGRSTFLLIGALFLGIAAILTAFSVGSYLARDGQGPNEMRDNGLLNKTTYKSLEAWADGVNDQGLISLMAGFGLGILIMFVFLPSKKDIEKVNEVIKQLDPPVKSGPNFCPECGISIKHLKN